ncbi:cupin-like domain-containing protein [Pelagibacteraceae bacterium]|nr:cupin-like domain-containing protein [Pelagibacteraceae bacterium]
MSTLPTILSCKNKHTRLKKKPCDEPYVIKKFSKNWDAQKKWNFDYIKNQDKNLKINAVKGNAASSSKKIKRFTLENYMKNITKKNFNSYLTTFYLFKKFPKLKNEINFTGIKKRSLIRHYLAWIGPKGSITGFHLDWSENINVQIRGEKNFYLVSPKYNNQMYISEKFERISITSKVDLKNHSPKEYPEFRKVKILKFNLKESDAIYIPRGWWHYVETLRPSISVSVHFWSFKNFFRDLIFEISKVFLHDIGFYKKNNCACHEMVQGKRMKRG